MYKHILIATDGSELSNKAVEHGIALAKFLNAKVTAVTVIIPWRAAAPREAAVPRSEKQYQSFAKHRAAKCLATATELAKASGIACSAVTLKNEAPWKAIVDTVGSMHCDLVVMASHGWKGVAGIVLGSETQNVLTHSSVPVLVHRLTPGHRPQTSQRLSGR